MTETYKLMTGKYDHKIVNFMPKQHDSSTSLPTRGHRNEGKYNFRSTYSPTANRRPEHEETNEGGAVEEPEM